MEVTGRTKARQAAAALVMGTSLWVGAAAAQSGGTASPRGLDFRLPPADDDRDSKVQGPSDNGLPPRQENPRPAPKAVPKAAPTADIVQPPRITAPTTAPKSAPAPKTAPAPKAAAPKSAAPTAAGPQPAPKAGPTGPMMTAPVAPAPSAAAPAGPDPLAPVPDGLPTSNSSSDMGAANLPSTDNPAENGDNSAFLPTETDEAEAGAVTEPDAEAEPKDGESPWWAWPLAGLIALIAAVLYWRRQTALGPEDYLEIAQSQAEVQRKSQPQPQPQEKAARDSAAARPVSVPPQPVKPVVPAVPSSAQPLGASQRPAGAAGAFGAGQAQPRAAVPPTRPSGAVADTPAPFPPYPPMPAPNLQPQHQPQPQSQPASAFVPAPTPTPAPVSAGVVPAWTNLDQYVSAGSLVRRPADDQRADVDMDVAVRSIRIEADHIAVGFILTLSNRGVLDATGLMVRIALGQGSAMHEAVLGRFYDGAGGSILRDDMELVAGRSEQLSSEVKLPRTAIEPMILGGKPLLVPVLAADVTYHWDGEGDAFGQIAAAYVLGRAAVGGTEKLAPIPLDRAPLAVDRPGARATEVTRRQ